METIEFGVEKVRPYLTGEMWMGAYVWVDGYQRPCISNGSYFALVDNPIEHGILPLEFELLFTAFKNGWIKHRNQPPKEYKEAKDSLQKVVDHIDKDTAYNTMRPTRITYNCSEKHDAVVFASTNNDKFIGVNKNLLREIAFLYGRRSDTWRSSKSCMPYWPQGLLSVVAEPDESKSTHLSLLVWRDDRSNSMKLDAGIMPLKDDGLSAFFDVFRKGLEHEQVG